MSLQNSDFAFASLTGLGGIRAAAFYVSDDSDHAERTSAEQ
jgi:hypothetical protein